MLDFNTAGHQTDGNASAIPPDSIVPMKMSIRPPRAGKEGTQNALFCRSDKGNEFIDVEFEVGGQFAGRKIWDNFTLFGNEKAIQISMRTLRAIIESARQINPQDASPQASAARQLSDWSDFNGMVFLARVKCVVEQNRKDGNHYVNNEIAKIITPDMPEYQIGEVITDKPLPTIPDASAKPAGPAAGPGGFGTFGAPATAAQATTATPGGFDWFGAKPAAQPTAAAPATPAAGAPPTFGGMPGWANK